MMQLYDQPVHDRPAKPVHGMTMSRRLKRTLMATPVALCLGACSQLGVDQSPSGAPQSPQQYGGAAGDTPVAGLTAAQAQRLNGIMAPLLQKMNRPIAPIGFSVTAATLWARLSARRRASARRGRLYGGRRPIQQYDANRKLQSCHRPASTASQRKSQCRADFLHSLKTEAGDALAQTLLGNRDRIMQVDGASRLHSVVDVQYHFGGYVPDGGRDGGHRYSR